MLYAVRKGRTGEGTNLKISLCAERMESVLKVQESYKKFFFVFRKIEQGKCAQLKKPFKPKKVEKTGNKINFENR